MDLCCFAFLLKKKIVKNAERLLKMYKNNVIPYHLKKRCVNFILAEDNLNSYKK